MHSSTRLSGTRRKTAIGYIRKDKTNVVNGRRARQQGPISTSTHRVFTCTAGGPSAVTRWSHPPLGGATAAPPLPPLPPLSFFLPGPFKPFVPLPPSLPPSSAPPSCRCWTLWPACTRCVARAAPSALFPAYFRSIGPPSDLLFATAAAAKRAAASAALIAAARARFSAKERVRSL